MAGIFARDAEKAVEILEKFNALEDFDDADMRSYIIPFLNQK
jgi:hypothetical protein